MTAGFAGGAALPDSELPDFGGMAAFSAGLASSSAMMRRIDARISSIEGSWTFAGCVISDSTSSASPTLLHQARRGWPVPVWQTADLSPVQASLDGFAFCHALGASGRRASQRAANQFAAPRAGYVTAINDCKQATRRIAGSPQRPSGMRTPAQLSRT